MTSWHEDPLRGANKHVSATPHGTVGHSSDDQREEVTSRAQHPAGDVLAVAVEARDVPLLLLALGLASQARSVRLGLDGPTLQQWRDACLRLQEQVSNAVRTYVERATAAQEEQNDAQEG